MTSWRMRIVLAGFCILLVAVSFEVGFRWFVPWNNYFAHNRRAVRLAEHIPYEDRAYSRPRFAGDEQEEKIIRIRTDGDGFILPDNGDSSRPIDVTIAFLGGSTTEDLWVTEELRWPFLVGQTLSDSLRKNVRIINAGVSGSNLQNSINAFPNKIIEHHPDIVVAMHAFNDCLLLMSRGNYDDWSVQTAWENEWSLRRLYEFLTSYSSTLGYIRHRYSTKKIGKEIANPPQPASVNGNIRRSVPLKEFTPEFSLRLKMLVAMIRATGAVPVLMTEPSRDRVEHQEAGDIIWSLECSAFNDQVRTIAQDEHLLLVDLEGRVKDPSLYFDTIHYNDRGTLVVAAIVSDALREVATSIPRKTKSVPDASVMRSQSRSPGSVITIKKEHAGE